MIVFLDDDLVAAEVWSFDLNEAGYDLKLVRTAQDLMEFLEEQADYVSAFLVDFQLPIGHVFDSILTDGGLRTGFFVIARIRAVYQARVMKCPPIIAVTNRSDYAEDISRLQIDGFLEKRRHTSEHLLELVKRAGVAPDRVIR